MSSATAGLTVFDSIVPISLVEAFNIGMADAALAPPRKSVELEDPGAHELGRHILPKITPLWKEMSLP